MGTTQPVLRPVASSTPSNGRMKIQTVTLQGATGGTFTLTLFNQTTSAIAYNASASTVQTAIQALSNVGAGNATVTGSAGGPWTITFANSLLAMKKLLPAPASLTGSQVTIRVSCADDPDPGWLYIRGGKNTRVVLNSTVTALVKPGRTTDDDMICNVDVGHLCLDRNNVVPNSTGLRTIVFGIFSTETRRLWWDRIHAHHIEIINAPAAEDGSQNTIAFGFISTHYGLGHTYGNPQAEAQTRITNILVEDIYCEGANCVVAALGSSATNSNPVNVYHDNIIVRNIVWNRRSLVTATTPDACVQLGGIGYGNRCLLENISGKNAGDVPVGEIDAFRYTVIRNVESIDGRNTELVRNFSACYSEDGTTDMVDTQVAYIYNSRVRKINQNQIQGFAATLNSNPTPTFGHIIYRDCDVTNDGPMFRNTGSAWRADSAFKSLTLHGCTVRFPFINDTSTSNFVSLFFFNPTVDCLIRIRDLQILCAGTLHSTAQPQLILLYGTGTGAGNTVTLDVDGVDISWNVTGPTGSVYFWALGDGSGTHNMTLKGRINKCRWSSYSGSTLPKPFYFSGTDYITIPTYFSIDNCDLSVLPSTSVDVTTPVSGASNASKIKYFNNTPSSSGSPLNVWATIPDGMTIDVGATNGLKIGTSTSKLSIFGAAVIGQQAQTVDLKQVLVNFGLYSSSSGATPLNLGAGAFTTTGLVTAGSINISAATASVFLIGSSATFATSVMQSIYGDHAASAWYVNYVYPTWRPTSDLSKEFRGVYCAANISDTNATGNMTGSYSGGIFQVIVRAATRTVSHARGGEFSAYNLNAGTVSNLRAGYFWNQSDAGTVVESPTIYVGSPGGTAAITNQYGVQILNQGRASITTAYGLYIAAQSGATTNRAILVKGSNTIELEAGVDFLLPTSGAGVKFATAVGQLFAFHGATPVVQRSGAAQAAVATTASSQTTPFGYTTQAQADAIITLLNEIRATLVEKGLMKGSA